jgi:hypothetical protein
MTATRDFDDIARAWLDLMPDEVPDRAVAAVIDAVATTRQMRRPIVNFQRTRPMSRLLLAGAAAVLVVVSGIILLGPRRSSEVAGPSSVPLPTASASGPLVGAALDDALRATWLSTTGENPLLQNGAGPVSMTIGSTGTSIAASNFGPGYGFASSTGAAAPDRLELVLERASGDCPPGTRGIYHWQFFANRSELSLTTVSEDCPKRGAVFSRRWVRSLVEPTTVGAGVIDSMSPAFAITLPDDTYSARTLDDFIEIGGTNGYSLMVFKNPQTFVDPCSTDEERVPYVPGGEAFIEHFRSNDAFDVGATTQLTLDGRKAFHVAISGKSNYARCPDQPLYQYTPKACNCHFIVGPGGTDSMYLVEVGTDTFLFIVSPFGNYSERDVMNSLRIPATLPGS